MGNVECHHFLRLNRAVLDRCRRCDGNDPRTLWHGHRVFFLDGSSFSMPDTPDLRAAFGQNLKQTLGMDVLRCESWQGVWKELLVFVLVYNLVRRVMEEAARRQEVEPERISFVDAWRWLREARLGEELPPLRVNPRRAGRVEPRVKKRRPKQYDLMNKPRAVLRERLLHETSPPQEVAA